MKKEQEHKNWKEMSKEEKIKKLEKEKEMEISPEERKIRRLEKAMEKRRNWKEWREESEIFEIDPPPTEIDRPQTPKKSPPPSKNTRQNQEKIDI